MVKTPSISQIKAADKRLGRLEKPKGMLTNSTANGIAQVVGITREELEAKIFGQTTLSVSGPRPPRELSPTEVEIPYQHCEIIHEYEIKDIRGHLTKIKTAEKVKILKREITVGGSYWESSPRNLKAYFNYEREGKSPWESPTPVEVTRIERTAKLFRWDTHHEPALLRGDVVWFLTTFELKDEFTLKTCSDAFHSMEEIGAFTWRIRFPRQRPAKRWWVAVEYHPSLPSTTTLASHTGRTTKIDWSISNLPKGVVYFINWEW